MSWATEEFRTLDLGDQRLNRRTALLAERLAAQPTASIPAACGGWAETQRAYRLFSHDDVGWEDLLAPHATCTQQRMLATAPLGAVRFTLPARPGQPARVFRQHVWVERVQIKIGRKDVMDATCVIAREIDPPEDVKGLEWRLITNREAPDFEAAVELIDWYRARWEIELFFMYLKTAVRSKRCSCSLSNGWNGH
ncbi:Mobile element protein [Thauera aromatica K172]|uniref:Mobile element protein n=1 Tax=Thauera aromatica K172 TaxID=44139 RepID=A0A2R4BS01_THAAR|nr:Mobile element protein [Thauera aromatica K172]